MPKLDSWDIGGPDRIRTCDLCLRRAALYPAELRVPQSPGRGFDARRSLLYAPQRVKEIAEREGPRLNSFGKNRSALLCVGLAVGRSRARGKQ